MSRIIAMKEMVEKALRDNSKPWTKYLALAEKKTGFDRLYVFLVGIAALGLYLVIGIGQQLITNIIAFAYPAYCSMKALETLRKDDDTKWLTYWVVFAVFNIIEYFSDFIVGWFPVYWLFKCIFYGWLMIPTEYNGSLIIYRRILRPKFIQYQPNVDQFLSNAQQAAMKMTSNVLSNEKTE